ncbi:VHS-domain-containing protein [Coniophora puteana RWD-64-598 SS2]|uniref:VHS-domain-containing protein n=1 Tax=Coniophora puteana (strain RWD-64-598) TaxID=741705 RepID=A0A5M3M9J6_CONPW|nr:VHS-domain-containing protein [Coniophora puteana RWD-64-598 SS2]EIW75918.1 VHS-domain-containing protein [Coniophora puteana RWD-64-598 SS2]
MLGASPSTPWFKVSQLEVLISRACEPTHTEPNYAAQLEVAEYINRKKANTPRDAAQMIARLGNHRNPHLALLALDLLSTLVGKCGYPFHLQIATKDFLNELVRRFPERPPPFPNPVMGRILELIREWKEGICVNSRWKEDLGNIRDMYRLLVFKGYRFRESRRGEAAVAQTEMDLKSAHELESLDREAQSAKLQELIRRGTPRDLAAAQELMKALAGAEPEKKPDYRSLALDELAKVESKVILLSEMLDNVDERNGEQCVKGDAYDQVATILKNARPKLQKWIADAESEDDPESLGTFLTLNDQINTVLARQDAFEQGNFEAVRNLATAAAEPGAPNSSSNTGGRSLIDFDDLDFGAGGSSSPPAASANRNGSGGIDDLSGLFATSSPLQQQPGSSGMGGGMGMGMGGMNNMGGMGRGGMGSSTSPPPVNASTRPQIPGAGGSASGYAPSYFPHQMGSGSIALATTPKSGSPAPSGGPGTTTPAMGGSAFGGMGMGMGMGGGMGMGAPMAPARPGASSQSAVPATSTGPQSAGKDPFADLAGLF